MKKTLLFSVALAGLMPGSCSSSDDLNVVELEIQVLTRTVMDLCPSL